jgi:sugar/nucleoside kinase (ribokinase family)
VHVTGYGLQSPQRAAAITDWVRRLQPEIVVLLDPGPLPVDAEALGVLLPRVDCWSGSAEEAALAADLAVKGAAARAADLTVNGTAARSAGPTTPEAAAAELAERVGTGAVVRDGAGGCVLAVRGAAPVRIAAPQVRGISTNGAGDVHVGTFLAALGAGRAPEEAAMAANEAAARHVAARS